MSYKTELKQLKTDLKKYMKIWNKASDDYEAGIITWDQYNKIDNKKCDFENEISLLEDLING